MIPGTSWGSPADGNYNRVKRQGSFFFLTYLDREISSRFLVMERYEIWGCVRGLGAVLYSNEQEWQSRYAQCQ